jgi:hypothetical protein
MKAVGRGLARAGSHVATNGFFPVAASAAVRPSEDVTSPAGEEVSSLQNIIVGRYGREDGADYAGWIEPEDRSWIVFVKEDHTVEVFLDRDPVTGAVL